MVECQYCHEVGVEWYTDQFGKSRLGYKIDVNTYRPHKCISNAESEVHVIPTHRWCFLCGTSFKVDKPCKHWQGKPLPNAHRHKFESTDAPKKVAMINDSAKLFKFGETT